MGHDKLFHKNKLARLQKNRKLRKILIVCEGEKTEPNYFVKFDANPEVYDNLDIHGTGYNTVSLIREAIRIRDEAILKREPYIETWCVFDKDDFPIETFESAIRLAEQNRIKCAYSIEAFEIWYMLHFHFYDAALSRHQYKEKLSELLKKTYTKNDTEMYRLLKKKQDIAMKNARTLFYRQCTLPLKDQNPVTTVFQLIERLLG
jgi:hypothetical protein